MGQEYRSRVYTDRPAYADYEPAEKFEALKEDDNPAKYVVVEPLPTGQGWG